MSKSIIITGTDTDIGKTIFAAALTAALGATYWKPIQAGLAEETDSQLVERLSGQEILPEAYRLNTPASPHVAAEIDGLEIDLDKLQLPKISGALIVEGAGGLMVPVTRQTTYLNIFAKWKAPIVLCARTSLGTINHSLLSVFALKNAGCEILGIAFIGDENKDSEQTICEMGQVKRLGRLPRIADLNSENLSEAFNANFDIMDFKQ
ncbi:MAG: dethiobiotin synthase [Hyphomicrobiales bacterium]|nr:ATP-dependent dethiobiotin synthetase BioD [Hyphomicrobiales bacterium]PCH50770.1 MAG: dethiobiotin synthase [Hyphomicrobiales bacterium]